MALANTSKLVDTGLLDRLGVAVRSAGARYTQYRLYRRTYYELASLSGRELADLGIDRSGIRRIAAEAAYGTEI